jgi:hypothetical protein
MSTTEQKTLPICCRMAVPGLTVHNAGFINNDEEHRKCESAGTLGFFIKCLGMSTQDGKTRVVELQMEQVCSFLPPGEDGEERASKPLIEDGTACDDDYPWDVESNVVPPSGYRVPAHKHTESCPLVICHRLMTQHAQALGEYATEYINIHNARGCCNTGRSQSLYGLSHQRPAVKGNKMFPSLGYNPHTGVYAYPISVANVTAMPDRAFIRDFLIPRMKPTVCDKLAKLTISPRKKPARDRKSLRLCLHMRMPACLRND